MPADTDQGSRNRWDQNQTAGTAKMLATMATWCECTAAKLATRLAGVVGPYRTSPESTVVNCIDEKPSTQPPGRAQSYPQVANPSAPIGYSDGCKHNGISTLFAALEVATDKVTAARKRRHHRVAFLGLMNGFVAAFLGETAPLFMLDNLSTHESRSDRWLTRYRNLRFSSTLTRASRLDRVEI